MPAKAFATTGELATPASIRDFSAGGLAAEETNVAAMKTLRGLEYGIDGDYTRCVVHRLLLAMLAASLAWAQYEVPRKANEYPAHASWPEFEIGAEYLVHSIPTDNGSLFARDYLVVEVAIYPGKQPVMISDAHF